MSQKFDPCLIILIQGPAIPYVVHEAERVRDLYKNRASISRPMPHSKREGWFCVFVDVFPVSDLPKVLEGGL